MPDRFYKSLDEQKRVFRTVLERCAEVGGKILTVHSLQSVPAVLDMIEAHLPGGRDPRDLAAGHRRCDPCESENITRSPVEIRITIRHKLATAPKGVRRRMADFCGI
jgi:hypothetical protein